MQLSLFLLVLMGQWSFFMCELYKYHFVNESKTWEEAKNYCRDNYTDLATVYSMEDMKRLHQCVKGNQADKAWIGLKTEPGVSDREWCWSQLGVEYNDTEDNWRQGEPNDEGGKENCVVITTNLEWMDYTCDELHYFICYDGSSSSKKFHLIKAKKTWLEAQHYCRQNHTDLVSGIDQLEHKELKEEIENLNKNDTIAIGLFRDSWFWSDGSTFSFRNWHVGFSDHNADEHKCAVVTLNEEGRWTSEDCDSRVPFFCYEDNVILVNENKSWEEAIDHCRENYGDLVSIPNRFTQRWVQEKAKKANSEHVWLGMRYTCVLDFWFWVSDESMCYQNWAPNQQTDGCDMSGAMERSGTFQWFSLPDEMKLNFICGKLNIWMAPDIVSGKKP